MGLVGLWGDGVELVGSGVQWVAVEYPVRGIFTWLTR